MRTDPRLIGFDYCKRKVLRYLRVKKRLSPLMLIRDAIDFVLTLDERDAARAVGLKPKRKAK